MHKSLYDRFAHWFNNDRGQVYFYSDPHFSDEEMKSLRTNYISDEEQVKRINAKIGKYDTIVILGDVGNTDWVRKIRGRKVLVMGNHDSGASNYQRIIRMVENRNDFCPKCGKKVIHDYATFASCGPDYAWCNKCGTVKPEEDKYEDNHLFDEVYEGPVFISEKILLSHEPIDSPYALNIHGHDHSKHTYNDDHHLNMCAENVDYTPVSLKDVVLSGALKKIDSIHRVTIDTATERAIGRREKEPDRKHKKLWIDDVREPPEGYLWVQTVREAKEWIVACNAYDECIDVIDIDHDAGVFASQGGDYIKLLDWLEETGRNIPIHIHSMNPVGIENMRRIIQRNGWKEV